MTTKPSTNVVTVDDVRAAQERIRGQVRRTPMIEALALKDNPSESRLMLKLECLQVTGSFKARGAMNKLLGLPAEQLHKGVVTASGGNHGLAVAFVGWLRNVPATVFLPTLTPPAKADKIRQWGAQVITEGSVWDDANHAAQAYAEKEQIAYFHPFADPAIIAGQGTIGLEILEDMPEVDTVLVAIGGGGLISGVSLTLKALKPSIRVIGIEPVGAPTLYNSLAAGQPITLDEIRTAAGTLAPRASAPINFALIREYVDEIVLVTDEEMAEAARWLWFEMGVAAELSGAAALAALMTGKVELSPAAQVCVLVCGAGTDGITK